MQCSHIQKKIEQSQNMNNSTTNHFLLEWLRLTACAETACIPHDSLATPPRMQQMSNDLSGSQCHLSLGPNRWDRSTGHKAFGKPIREIPPLLSPRQSKSPKGKCTVKRREKSASRGTFFLGVHRAAPLEVVIQGVQQVTPSQRRLCQLGPLGKRCVQWSFFSTGLPGYVNGKRKYMQFSELDSRSLYSQHISSHLGFTEPPLGRTAVDAVEARLEPRSGEAGTILWWRQSGLQN